MYRHHVLSYTVYSIFSLFLLLVVAKANPLFAQERIVSGKVISSEDRSSLPGVNVVIRGTSKGIITDLNGNYKLTVSADDVLEFSFVGMQTQQHLVGTRSTLDVLMDLDNKQLEEVVVVAYGEDSKNKIIGAVSSIGASVIQNQQITSVTRALSGTIPGVNVIATNGQPGEDPVIRVRGVASIDSGNDPIIVLDGSVYNASINTIPSSDISSISVLKDASAAALYGSRAANGVILITTKQGTFATGKLGKPSINFRMTSGVSYRARKDYQHVNAAQAMRMEWEALKNDAVDQNRVNERDGKPTSHPGQKASAGLLNRVRYNPFGGSQSPIDSSGNFTSNDLLWDTDWEKAIFTETPLRNEYNLSFSDGSDRIRYFLGGSVLDQSGQVKQSSFKRYTVRANLDLKLTKWLLVGLRQSLSSSEQGFPIQSGTTFSNGIQWIRTVSNIYPIYRRDTKGNLVREDGELVYDAGAGVGDSLNASRPVLAPGNTAGLLTLNRYLRKYFSTVTNAMASATFLKDFTIKTSYQLNRSLFDLFDYGNPALGPATTVKGRVRRDKDITTEWTWTNSLSWHKEFGSHTIDALLLQELYNYELDRMNARGTGFLLTGLYQLNSASTPESISGSLDQERISSLMGRVKYNFMNKYFLEASYRRDASSRFSPENRVGNFFSVGGSWILTAEPFLSSDILNFAKIRISYGQLGNNQIKDPDDNTVNLYFPYLATYETGFDQAGVSGIYSARLANPALTWETLNSFNIGLDFGFFGDRLTGSIDMYENVTKGLVTGFKISSSSGVRGNTIIKNIGDVTNSGIELQLAGDVIKKNDFRWRLSGNISFERNVITKFPEGERINGSKKLKKGKSIYDFWIRDYAGVNSENGKPMWWRDSVNSEGKVVIGRFETTDNYTKADRYFMGTALPWARGGFSSRIDFKGFDFSFLINFSLGGKILDTDYSGLMHGGRRAGNQYSADILKRWQQAGDITNVPRLSSSDRGSSRSTRFLFDATYARFRNVTLGYSLPPAVLDKLGGVVKSFRIFFSGENLFTLFGRQGLDPEQNIQGTTDGRSSTMKSYSGGLELTF